MCGEEVFFHTNGFGDLVVFDELGPPWPKHGCFPARGQSQPTPEWDPPALGALSFFGILRGFDLRVSRLSVSDRGSEFFRRALVQTRLNGPSCTVYVAEEIVWSTAICRLAIGTLVGAVPAGRRAAALYTRDARAVEPLDPIAVPTCRRCQRHLQIFSADSHTASCSTCGVV